MSKTERIEEIIRGEPMRAGYSTYPNNVELIDKKYVHKHRDENVMISGVRKMLPRRISKDIFENSVVNNVTRDEQGYLLEYYAQCEDKCNETCYVLRTSSKIIREHINDYMKSEKQIGDDWHFLKGIKRHEEFENGLCAGCILEDEDSEIVETKILNIMGLNQFHIKDSDRMRIYHILRKFEEIPWREGIFYSRMHVDTNHSFFFEHPNEHVPGIMLVEAIRQFGIACSHMFIGVPLNGVHFVLSSVNVDYNGYLELNYPIKLEGRLDRIKRNKAGYPTYVDFGTTVYQKNEPLVKSSTIGKYLPNELYSILRRNYQNYNQMHRFSPRHGISMKCILKDDQNNEYIADLINISDDGFCAKSLNSLSKSGLNHFELITPLGNIGRSAGRCELIWQEALSDVIYSGYRIKHLNESDRSILTDVLRIYCYLNEDEVIL